MTTTVTGKFAICNLCGIQWQLKDHNENDAHACPFCGALRSEGGVRVLDESSDQDDLT